MRKRHLQRINKVVDAGHILLKKEEKLSARCDPFVLETNIHYPTHTGVQYRVYPALSGHAAL